MVPGQAPSRLRQPSSIDISDDEPLTPAPPATAADHFRLRSYTPYSLPVSDQRHLYTFCVRPASRYKLPETDLAQSLLLLVAKSSEVEANDGPMAAGGISNLGDREVDWFSRGPGTPRWRETPYQNQIRAWYFTKTGRFSEEVGHYKPDENRRLQWPYLSEGEEIFANLFGHVGERKSIAVDNRGRPAVHNPSLAPSAFTSTSTTADLSLSSAELQVRVASRIRRQQFIKFQQCIARTAVYLTTAWEYGGTFLGLAQSGSAFSRMVLADIGATSQPHIMIECSDAAFGRLQSASQADSSVLSFVQLSAVDLLDNKDNVDIFANDLGKPNSEDVEVDPKGVETYIQLHRLSSRILLQTPTVIPLPRIPPPALPDFLSQHLDPVLDRIARVSVHAPQERFDMALRGRDKKDLRFPTSMPATPADEPRHRSPPPSKDDAKRARRTAAPRATLSRREGPTSSNAPPGPSARRLNRGDYRDSEFEEASLSRTFLTSPAKTPAQLGMTEELIRTTVQSSAARMQRELQEIKSPTTLIDRLDVRLAGRPRSRSMDAFTTSGLQLLSEMDRQHAISALERSGPPHVRLDTGAHRSRTTYSASPPRNLQSLNSHNDGNLLNSLLDEYSPALELTEANLEELEDLYEELEPELPISDLIEFLTAFPTTFIAISRSQMTRYLDSIGDSLAA